MYYRDKTRPRVGNYAFWSYDQYPYMLGGKIVSVHRREHVIPTEPQWNVEIEEFGAGFYFVCRVELPPALGKATKEKLEALKDKQRARLNAVVSDSDRELIRELESNGRTTAIVDRIVPDHAKMGGVNDDTD